MSEPNHTAVIQLQKDPETGHFLPGNTAAAGLARPDARRAFDLRRAAQAAVSNEDMQDVFRSMVNEAKAGNVFAARFVCEYTIGKPAQMTEAESEDVAGILEALWMKLRRKPAEVPAHVDAG